MVNVSLPKCRCPKNLEIKAMATTSRLWQKACPQQAIETSQSDDERSSATKNYGLTSWKMAMVIFNQNRDLKLICFHFKEAFKHFTYARENGASCKPEDWLSSLEASCSQCWEDFHNCAYEMKMEQRLRVINEMLPFLSTNMQVCAFLDLANTNFHIGINALQNGDFKKCMYQMSECHYPIEKVKELRQFLGSRGGMDALEEDVVMHMRRVVENCGSG
ncbi:hypothetical protein KUTeg_017004 [Tegillarca granosa]|uniref:Uncharacterized protein n=1 Tax=Tegillarca granosa TaxID=220873 RepID=A0ABQ9EMM3_TEGGR|nr:hypothetical protein KUTeg_017004 [Tegillarca granosa]